MTREQLISQFKELGIKPGMDLMMHSSLRRIGPVDGGADTVIDALLEILGPEGTLMMSTVSGNVNPAQPVFHVEHTRSTVGALSNVFRKRKNAVRSLHPVHSITACGKRAAFYTEGHLDANTPWSPDSPYGKIMRNGAHILFLGVNFTCNTCLHALEIEARVPGLHTENTSTLYVIDHNHAVQAIEHHWHAPKKDFYTDMEHLVARENGIAYGRIGKGISRLVDAGILREVLIPVFRNTPELAIMPLSDSDYIWE